MATRLYFVRHGENLANITKEFSHRIVDYSLTPKGMLQAQQTGDYFRNKGIHAVYSSPLKRAVETAKIIGSEIGLGFEVLEGLREVNVGLLEGRPVTAENWGLYNRIFDDWFAGRREASFPGGEDHFTLWQRVSAAYGRILMGAEGKNIVVVGHGGVFAATVGNFCPGIDLDRLMREPNHNCSITEMVACMHGGTFVGEMVAWAWHGHLHGEAAELVLGSPDVANLPGGTRP
jgi:broad specificity phosphatase PhoE